MKNSVQIHLQYVNRKWMEMCGLECFTELNIESV